MPASGATSGLSGKASGTLSICGICDVMMSTFRQDDGLRRRIIDLLQTADLASSQRASFIHFLNTMLPSMTDDIFLHYVMAVSEYTTKCFQASS